MSRSDVPRLELGDHEDLREDARAARYVPPGDVPRLGDGDSGQAKPPHEGEGIPTARDVVAARRLAGEHAMGGVESRIVGERFDSGVRASEANTAVMVDVVGGEGVVGA